MSSFLSMSSFPLRNIYLHRLQHCTKDLSQAFDLERRSVRFRPKKEVLQLFRAFAYATVFRLWHARAHSYSHLHTHRHSDYGVRTLQSTTLRLRRTNATVYNISATARTCLQLTSFRGSS